MQEKVAGSPFVCLARASGTTASTGLHTARAACFHLKRRKPDFPWPCCLDAFMTAHHGHLPSTPIHFQHTRLEIPSTLPSKSYVAALLFSPRGISFPGTAKYLWDFSSCTILLLLHHLHFSGSSNTLWPFLSLWSPSWSKDCLWWTENDVLEKGEADISVPWAISFTYPADSTSAKCQGRDSPLCCPVSLLHRKHWEEVGISPWSSCGSKMSRDLDTGCKRREKLDGKKN